MEVLIDNRQTSHEIPLPKVREKAQAILDVLGYPEAELSILIVDDPQIAEFNGQYLNRQGPTNVIAFPMREGDFPTIHPNILGDVVISVDTAEKEADDAGISMFQRFIQLLVHGILHLLGYDHVDSEKDAEKMTKKTNDLLLLLNEPIQDPL